MAIRYQGSKNIVRSSRRLILKEHERFAVFAGILRREPRSDQLRRMLQQKAVVRSDLNPGWSGDDIASCFSEMVYGDALPDAWPL